MSNKKLILYKSNKNFFGFFILLILIAFAVCIVRLFWLQVVQGPNLTNKLSNQISSMRVLISPRGTILDRNGKELAVSLLTKSLYVNSHEMAHIDEKKIPGTDPQRQAAKLLAPLLNRSEDELFAIFTMDRYFVWLSRTLEPQQYDAIAKVIKDNKLRGFHFLDESKRYYPQGKTAAHILGFVGTDDKGLEGMELAYDALLSGAGEQLEISVDGVGRPVDESVFTKFNPAKLHKLYLTIDHNIQYVVERALDTALQNTKVQGASVIVMDPKTGEIIAMSNRPTFDPNTYYKFSQKSFSNRSVSYIYEPGSTFKPIVVSGAIEDKLIRAKDTFYDTGSMIVGDRVIKNWDGEANGQVTYEYILANSLNTGMVNIGMQLGAKRINHYAHLFGLGKPTGIELPGEESGILFETENMLPINVATMSIGQGLAVTPIQLIRAIAAIANDGIMVQPHIVKRIERSDGQLIQAEKKNDGTRIISSETAAEIRRIMEMVIEVGGGKAGKIPGYRIAGKTGTAEKLNSTGSGYEYGAYIASFVGFAPADNPRFVVLIMLDNPQGAFYGSQVAAPVFKEIMEQLLSLTEVPMNSNILPLPTNPIPQKSAAPANITPKFIGETQVIMPDVRGMSYRDVVNVLALHHLRLNPVGSGIARGQSIAPGATINTGSNITVKFE